MNRVFVEAAFILVLVMAIAIAQAAVPPIMSYQGRLTDLAGQNVTDGNYTVRFTIYDAAMAVWAETLSVNVSDGLFAATFGLVHPLPSTMFANPDLWLGMKVGADPEITPRTRLTTVAYAFASDNGGVSYLPLTGGTMTGPITSTGAPAITMGKGNFGFDNTNAGSWAFVAGLGNDASGTHSAVGGGASNTASGLESVVGGGGFNDAIGQRSSIGGGESNSASGDYASIGGGTNNIATGIGASVGGGRHNRARGAYSVVGGGGTINDADSNFATGNYSTVGGGYRHGATGYASTVGGGEDNQSFGNYSTIAGGRVGVASGLGSALGGGYENEATGDYSTAGGGRHNAATGNRSTVGGGVDNQADGDYSFAAGNGCVVTAWAEGAVAVGMDNTANAPHAVALGNGCGSYGIGSFTVGESAQTISGANYSVAMGRRPSASEPGQFVFADSIDAIFGAFTPNGFHVRASGGVGLGTGSPDGRALVVDNQFTGAGNVLLDLNASVDITFSGRDVMQIEVGGSATDIQYIECERGSDIEFRVNGDGNVTADGTFTGGGADFAELVRISTGFASVSPGDVMVIDPANPQSFVRADSPRSTLVAGVFSTQPGFMASERDWDESQLAKTGVAASSAVNAELPGTPVRELAAQIDEVPLAVVGIVPCKVSAENGPIRVGDLLVTSATPGHAMRDDNPRPGTIVGKALAPLKSGTGIIKLLVTLQ